MMDFENVEFSNTVNNIKYLCCADCEVGLIGFHMIHNWLCAARNNKTYLSSLTLLSGKLVAIIWVQDLRE